MKINPLQRLSQEFTSHGSTFSFFSLPQMANELGVSIQRLPVCLRIVLESLLRNCDGKIITEQDVRALATWNAHEVAPVEIPFVVARVLLQDFTGVPLLVDLAAMRSAVSRLGHDPGIIEPLVPVELVVDHSIQVDVSGVPGALNINMQIEHRRNRERYELLKWGQQAFKSFKVVPPGVGIVHQVNLEYLSRGVFVREEGDGSRLVFPDTLVGTDSHTTMVNGLGIVAWGVGGIEAEAAMLGQPLYFLMPEVVGVHITGRLRQGVTATDLVLTITELLRKTKVVGKFIEFFGEGARSLSVQDRATIGNMAPEYGATIGFFPFDDQSVEYLLMTGRSVEQVSLARDYFVAQEMFGIPGWNEVDYSLTLELNLDSVQASVSGPKRPQDRISLPELGTRFRELLAKPVATGGYGHSEARSPVTVNLGPAPCITSPAPKGGGSQEPQVLFQSQEKNTSQVTEQEMANNRPTPDLVTEMLPAENNPDDREPVELKDGSVVIAAITSCTNTSNHVVMLAAGLLAKKAVERGLRTPRHVKASLAPGSRVVSDYLAAADLQRYLDELGFNLVGYGCMTCIGNSGPLPAPVERTLMEHDLVVASVLSGNRNFEGRIHALIKSNFLMSPPLVVAFALAGRVDIDITNEPLGTGSDGKPVYLRDIWPTTQELQEVLPKAVRPEAFQRVYSSVSELNPAWNEIQAPEGHLYRWNPQSTYIQEPPFFDRFSLVAEAISPLIGMRALWIFGDSITTDHISPAGTIKKKSPAGEYLTEHGVTYEDFNSYGSRRGNDRVMTRGTFANLRIRNLMVPGVEGGFTRNVLAKSDTPMPIYDAAQVYAQHRVPLIVFAGKEYGTGSSRDWAAKGTRLLGVRAVVAESFERIHRSNLVGMGVLPCSFQEGITAQTLKLDGSEEFSIPELSDQIQPKATLKLEIKRSNGEIERVPVIARLDTPIEVEYFRHGGILLFVLRQLLAGNK